MGSEAGPESDQRDTERVPVGLPVQYEYRQRDGRGLIVDVSDGGALVENPSLDVPADVDVTLRLRLGASTIEMSARVVRPTDRGFAVRFESSDARLQGLLEILLSRQGPRSDEID
jgi:hypothetical protein